MNIRISISSTFTTITTTYSTVHLTSFLLLLQLLTLLLLSLVSPLLLPQQLILLLLLLLLLLSRHVGDLERIWVGETGNEGRIVGHCGMSERVGRGERWDG